MLEMVSSEEFLMGEQTNHHNLFYMIEILNNLV